MPKATAEPITPRSSSKPNPDATLTEIIKRCAAAWRESEKADVEAGKLRQRGSKDLADEKWRDQHELSEEACALELRILSTRVRTARGYAAKCRAIAKICCDDIDLIIAAFILGRDAERLGIAEVPAFIQRRVESVPSGFGNWARG
jgi:hypothetical protein